MTPTWHHPCSRDMKRKRGRRGVEERSRDMRQKRGRRGASSLLRGHAAEERRSISHGAMQAAAVIPRHDTHTTDTKGTIRRTSDRNRTEATACLRAIGMEEGALEQGAKH
eukprot:366419-Chlamydomonas_euryale.AAC.4